MTSPAHWQRGDRVALVATDDPDTRLRPGDEGTVIRWDPPQEQLHVRWNSGSTLSMLPGEENLRFVRAGALAASGDTSSAAAELRGLVAARPSWEIIVRSFAAKGLITLPALEELLG